MAGKGFNHIPNAGEFRKNTSWGRTRQPKNIAGKNGTEIPAVLLTSLTGITTAGEQPTQGYNTENQRFLHLLVEDSNAPIPNPKLGYISASCWSVEYDNPFSLAILKDGKNMIGKKLYVMSPLKKKVIPVEIVSSHYVDPKGERVRS